jgi:serine/threonine protein kinase
MDSVHPISVALKSDLPKGWIYSHEITNFVNFFDKYIKPLWGKVESEYRQKWSKNSMRIGGRLGEYNQFYRTVHLIGPDMIIFRGDVTRVSDVIGGRLRVSPVVLIEPSADGNFRCSIKVKKKSRVKGLIDQSVEKWLEEYTLVKTLVHPNIFSPEAIIYRKGFKMFILEKYLQFDFFQYVNFFARDNDLKRGINIFIILKQIAEALNYLDEKDLSHRDVKLENVLLEINKEGQISARLIDFEMATNISVLRQKVSSQWKRLKNSYPVLLQEPIYLEILGKTPFYEPSLREYNKALSISVKKNLEQVEKVTDYLNDWEEFLRRTVRRCGTSACGSSLGNIPPEIISHCYFSRTGDQFAFGSMMRDIFNGTRLGFMINPPQTTICESLIVDLTNKNYWLRPCWRRVISDLDRVIEIGMT